MWLAEGQTPRLQVASRRRRTTSPSRMTLAQKRCRSENKLHRATPAPWQTRWRRKALERRRSVRSPPPHGAHQPPNQERNRVRGLASRYGRDLRPRWGLQRRPRRFGRRPRVFVPRRPMGIRRRRKTTARTRRRPLLATPTEERLLSESRRRFRPTPARPCGQAQPWRCRRHAS